MSHPASPESTSPELDLSERGAPKDGKPQRSERRLFMQLVCFECAPDLGAPKTVKRLGKLLERAEMESVIYEDVNHPTAVAVLSISEEPKDFVAKVRPALADPDLGALRIRPELTMLGRTYSSGFEDDLDFWLLRRPRETALNEAWPWAVWYPLRRGGAFERLEPKERGAIMREHAGIGKAYGAADLAHDIRLACHGLDANDNEFVIGLVGKELYPLSHVIQAMRKTRQTSEFIVQMGPFFVGHAVHRTRVPASPKA
jgi:Chlorite dismutase